MDITEIRELMGWIVGVFGVGVISLMTGVYSIIKAGKMIPKEVEKADLENKSKELSIADQFDELATKAAEKAVKIQERLSQIEENYLSLKAVAEEQEKTILKLEKTGFEQKCRLDAQEKKIEEQEGEILQLRCELNNARAYNSALIQQMKDESIIPIETSTVLQEDCTKLRKKRVYAKRSNGNVE